MKDEKELKEAAVITEENEMVICMNEPYEFEGKKYTEIDLTGLKNLKGSDLIAANSILEGRGSLSFIPEKTAEYTFVIAERATQFPLEFFEGLPIHTAMKVKNRVTRFLYKQD